MAGSRLDSKLVSCATLEPNQALEIWQELLKEVPLDSFAYPQQRLLPLVWQNLKSSGEPFKEESRLKGIYRRAWVINAMQQKACLEALKLLQKYQIPVIVLKAMAFESLLYGSTGARVASDFDLLVPFSQIDKAIYALEQNNWLKEKGWKDPQDRLDNEIGFSKGEVKLDLHYFLLREARHPYSDDDIWAKACPLEIAGYPTKTLSPTHHLLHLLVSADRESNSAARYLIDLFYLKKLYGDKLDSDRVIAMLKERHLLSRLNHLPLEIKESFGLTNLCSPSLLDKLWSWATRCVFDAEHKWNYLAFPFIDYWIHYRNNNMPKISLLSYLRRQLKVQGPLDFVKRTLVKIWQITRLTFCGRT